MNIAAAIVSQRTLLIAMIPVVFSVTHLLQGKGGYSVRFDSQQRIEILLTAAQGLFAAVAMFKFRFLRWEAYALLGLWTFQLFDPVIDHYLQFLPSVFGATTPPPDVEKIIVREYTSIAFLALVAYELIRYRKEIRIFQYFSDVWRTHVRSPAPSA